MSWTYWIIFVKFTEAKRGKKQPKANRFGENRQPRCPQSARPWLLYRSFWSARSVRGSCKESQVKALVLNTLGRGFDFEDVDIAAPMGREVLVNVQASGLCHTDLLFATHDIVPTPAVVGHEVAGVVAAGGPDLPTIRGRRHVV